MRSLVDDKSGRAQPREIAFVRAEQVEEFGIAPEDAGDVLAALAGDEAEIEACDTGSRGMKNVEAVPRGVFACANSESNARGERKHGEAVGTRISALPDDNHGLGRSFQDVRKGVLAIGNVRQCVGSGAEILIRIGEVDLGADERDLRRRGTPAFTNSRIEDRRFEPRVCADNQNRIGLLDAFNAGIEEIAGAAELRIELVSRLPAIERCRAEARQQILSARTFLRRRQGRPRWRRSSQPKPL